MTASQTARAQARFAPRAAVASSRRPLRRDPCSFGPTPVLPAPHAVRADKVCSVAFRLGLPAVVEARPLATGQVGDLVAVRVVREAPQYNQVELVSGRLARVVEGDLVIGALGHRKALKGFVGEAPTTLAAGMPLALLNIGGVIGRLTGGLQSLGSPTLVEYVGTLVDEDGPVNLARAALPPAATLGARIPLVVVAGTSMHAGKTQAAAELTRQLTRNGWRVAAAKLSGVACQRDLLAMQDNGAVGTASFVDCGLPSTVGIDDIVPVAKAILSALAGSAPDVIVVELGDGILGGYNVDALLADPELAARRAALVFCASDFVGAYGGIELLGQKGIRIDAVSGAATDSPMGVEFIASRFGVAAANAIGDGEGLYRLVQAGLARWRNEEAPQ